MLKDDAYSAERLSRASNKLSVPRLSPESPVTKYQILAGLLTYSILFKAFPFQVLGTVAEEKTSLRSLQLRG